MADPKSFSDYMREAQVSLGMNNTPTVSAPTQYNQFGLGAAGTAQARQGSQDGLSWLMDILTRPLSGMTNMIQSGINRSVDASKAGQVGDLGGVISNQVGNIFPLGDFLSGMLSTDPEQHRSFSEVIEQSTDKFGSLDPNYVNTQDNVNPVLKGVAGFVGDVALDPLTWIPGTQLIKAGSLGVRGAKAATTAVSGALKGAHGAQEAERAAQSVLGAAAKTPKATALGADAAQVERAAADLITPELRERVLSQPATATRHFEAIAESARRDVNRAVDTPQAQGIAKALDMFKPMSIKERIGAKISTLADAKPVPFAEGQGAGTAGTRWVQAAANAVSKSPVKVPYQHLNDAGEMVVDDMSKVLSRAMAGDSNAIKVARSFYDNYYVPRFAEGKANNQWVDVLGRPTQPPKAPKTTTTTILDSLGAYRKYKAENTEKVAAALGPKLLTALDRYTTPQGFDKVVGELRNILDQSLDVTTLSALKAPTRSLLETLGIKPESIPTGIHRPKNAPNTAPVAPGLAETAADQVARMGNDAQRVGRVDIDTALSMAQQGLDNAIFRDLIKKVVQENYPYRTIQGTYRTADLYGDGMARIFKQANEYFQWNLWKHLFAKDNANSLNKMARVEKLRPGGMTAAYKSEWGRTIMRIQERALDEHGIPLVMGVGDDTISLGMSQLLDVLEAANARAVYRTFWNGGTAVPPTNLMDAAVATVKGADRAEIERLLRQTSTRHKRSNGAEVPLPNNLVKGGRYENSQISGNVLVKELADLLEGSRSALRDVVADNSAAFQARRLKETGIIADNVLGELDQLYQSKSGFGPLLEGITDTSTRVKNLATEMGATQDATTMANTLIKGVTPPGDLATAKGAVSTAKAMDGAKSLREGQKAAVQEAQKAYEANAKALLDELGESINEAGNAGDLGTVIGARIHNGLLRKIIPVFSRTWGMNKGLASQFLQREGTYRAALTHFTDRLNIVGRSGLQAPDIANLLQNAKYGLPGKPETAQYQQVLQELWGSMFDTRPGAAGSMNNSFLRNGNNLEHVNDMLAKNNLPDSVTFDIAELDKAHKAGRLGEEILKQANAWDLTDDPVGGLYAIYKSFVDVQVQQTIVQDFVKTATDLSALAKEARPGFVKIDPSEFRSFGAYLPTSSYIQKEVLDNMRQIDRMYQQPMELKGPLGNLIRNYYQPALQAWKYGMTLPNPTHHIRNGISDMSLTALAEGFNPVTHRKGLKAAFQAMATRNSYDSVDAVRMLQGLEEIPDAGFMVSKGTREGFEITADGLYTAMANRGNLLSYRYLEHINDDKIFGEGQGALAKLWEEVQNSKGVRGIGGVSEWRDHFVRLHHAAVFIEKNINNTTYKTMDDLLDAASDAVRKWHPDGTDLTRAEQYFRLIIPFYSWQRKAIPLILESLLTHPDRVTVLPKAQYNLAVAMGVNPDSLADPFPQDQMFPSFMTEQLTGPIAKFDGRYYGINPGFAANDILNEWVGANPIRSLAGMSSPYLKMPFELLAGGQVGTGAKINDYSDYLDSNIPLVGALGRMTGYSPTGSVLSVLSEQGLDPQYQIQKGNYEPGERQTIGALNWLLGLGIQPMSMPSQINYAEIEKRNQAGTQSPESAVREWLLR